MPNLLDDMQNLNILENICFGPGVEVNISYLARKFGKHRNTIKMQVKELFDHKIIDRPIYPFLWMYKEYPLLVIARADLPRTEKIDRFLKKDEHIFAAFYVRDEEYNTQLIEYHKDLFSYNQWKKRLVSENIIPPRETRYPAHSLFFSTDNIVKYEPHSPLFVMEETYRNGGTLELNGYKISPLCFAIMKELMLGSGIRTNEHLLSQILNMHRKTVERKIASMLKDGIIGKPICRFPRFFVPPNYILVNSMIEIKKFPDKILKEIKADPNIPFALEAMIGRYNLFLFAVFPNVEEHFLWVEKYDANFHDCIGAMKNTYLSSKMTASIDQQDVSMGIIRQRKDLLHGKELIDIVK